LSQHEGDLDELDVALEEAFEDPISLSKEWKEGTTNNQTVRMRVCGQSY
jgi:hypothetical protein